jgi:predicted metal-dependent hydrolase
LVLSDRTIPYHLRVSPRARSVSLLVGPDIGLVVTAPHAADPGAVERFVGRHTPWIARQIDRYAALSREIPKRWPYGPTLPYRGIEHAISLRTGHPEVERTADRRLIVSAAAPGIERALRVLKAWYLQEAHEWLSARVELYARRMGVTWRKLRVRDQRRRWGSCSMRGHLHFNYRLVMAPPDVLDYVVVHELAHLRQMNHSPRFWALVAGEIPDAPALRRWLRTYGPYLTL